MPRDGATGMGRCMKLYSYFRSSASYRVRIALHFKGLAYEYVPVHLLRNGGEQLMPAYRKINRNALVPALIDENEVILQSLAIVEYLEETHPEPPLLPKDPFSRGYVRSIAPDGVPNPSARQPARTEISEEGHRRERRGEKRVVPALDRSRVLYTGRTTCERRPDRTVLLSRQSNRCRPVLDPAGLQRAALQRRYASVSNDPADLRCRDETGPLRVCFAEQTARCGVSTGSAALYISMRI